eukprot:scaffold50084_cov67-Cyclotella_meneghiniana.AAC.2
MSSGLTTNHRRRRKRLDAEAGYATGHRRTKRPDAKAALAPTGKNNATQDAASVTPAPIPIPAKKKQRVGRPSKTNNFTILTKLKTKQPVPVPTPAQSTRPISITPASTRRTTRSISQTQRDTSSFITPASTHRTTRPITRSAAPKQVGRRQPSVQRDPSSRTINPPEQFIAQPAKPTRPGPNTKIGWHSTKSLLERQKDCVAQRAEFYKNQYTTTLGDLHKAKRNILSDLSESTPPEPPIVTDDDLYHWVRNFVKNNPDSPVVSALERLGLSDINRKKEHFKDKDNLTRVVKSLLELNLYRYAEAERADIFGEMIFNGGLFRDPEAIKDVAVKIARSVTTVIFSAVALLKSIDSHAGALNDSDVQQYADIEVNSGLTNSKRGGRLLNYRWKLVEVRRAANAFAKYLLHIKHHSNTEWGDTVIMDFERTFRLAIEAHGLTHKASTEGIELAITGDGADLTSSTSTPGQTCMGFKLLDVDAKDPQTNEYCFYEYVEGSDLKLFRNAQTPSVCFPVGVCHHPETKGVVYECSKGLFQWYNDAAKSGLEPLGDQPQIQPIKPVGCGDMSFLMKLIALGGGCKIMRKFCPYCEVDWKDNMWHTVDSDNRCEICKSNERELCPHRQVNYLSEIKRKSGLVLLSTLIDDRKRRDANPTATLRDMLSNEEVDCFDGYDPEGNIIWTKCHLKQSIDPDGNLQRPTYDYCRNWLHTEEEETVVD